MNIHAFKKLKYHAEHSPHKGKLKNPDISAKGDNPLCGDSLEIDIELIKGKVAEGKFRHQGCALSAASASLLLNYAKGKTYTSLLKTSPEILLDLLGMPISPARITCAFLPLAVLQQASQKKK